MLEKQLQKQIIYHAEVRGWYVVKIITCNKNGFPDLMLLKNNSVIFIEVKRPGMKLRPLQQYRFTELANYGMTKVYCVNDIEQLKEILCD